jgi:hypothetical protein
MKNEARDAVANLRELVDRAVLLFGMDVNERAGSLVYLKNMVLKRTPMQNAEDFHAIIGIIDKIEKQVDVLEAIDDNDLMEHVFNDLKEISHHEC